jgi:hypothetical protein
VCLVTGLGGSGVARGIENSSVVEPSVETLKHVPNFVANLERVVPRNWVHLPYFAEQSLPDPLLD